MRFLITGATGFIGSHLVDRLVADGHEVTALVRSPQKAERLRELGVTLLHGDLTYFAQADLVLEPVDIVVHLAAVVTARDVATYEAINFEAVRDLLQALEAQSWRPTRLLFASSLAAAGPTSPGALLHEDDTLRPVDPYGEAKARAETLLSSASFPVTSFRPPVVLGPRDPAFLPIFQAAKRGVGFRVSGTPQQLSFVYIDDLVEALIRMAHDTRSDHRVYFTPHEQTIVLDDLWRALGEAFGRKVSVVSLPVPILRLAMHTLTALARWIPFTNPLDRKQYEQLTAPAFLCSPARIDRELGWRARIGLTEAVRRTAEGYARDGAL